MAPPAEPKPATYVPETNPWSIRYALANRGLRLDLPEDFVCCHIGGEAGPALAAHAATHPGARFVAAGGADAAVPAGDLRDLADLPDCDLIVVQGAVLRGGDSPNTVLDFVARKLKLGGALYVDYDSMPGAAAVHSLVQLLRVYAEAAGGGRTGPSAGEPFVTLSGERPPDSEARAAAILAFADRLLAVESPFTRTNKGVRARLDRLRGAEIVRFVERRLAAEWAPAWFHEVAATLQRQGILFGGPARLIDQVERLSFPQHLKRAVGAIADPIVEEAIKDLLANRAFRQDLFVRHPRPMRGEERMQHLLDLPFVLMMPAEAFSYRLKGPFGRFTFREDQYGPLLEALSAEDCRPKRGSELLAKPAFVKVRRPQLLRMLAILTGVGFAHPVRPEDQAAAAGPPCARLNVEHCRRALGGDEPALLVSPVTGGAVPVAPVQGLFLLAGAGRQGEPEDWARFALAATAAAGRRVERLGQVAESGGEALAALVEGARRFAAATLPVVRALGLAPLTGDPSAGAKEKRANSG